jgi:Vacuolar sorting-associated protein 13, extended-chorein
MDFDDEPYDDAAEEQNIDQSKILNYPVNQEEHDFAAYEVAAPTAPPVSVETSPLSVILGPWHGFTYEQGETIPSDGMTSMDFSLDKVTDNELHFQTSGRANDSNFTVVGKCTPGDTESLINLSWTQTFPVRYSPSYWQGKWDESTDTITGTSGSEADADEHSLIFILKRTAPEYLRFRPSPEDFQEDKVDALWTYACSAIRDQVRRKFMSWEYLEARRDNRKRFIELYIRDNAFGRDLDEEEDEELDELRASFTTADSRFYHSLAEYQIRKTTKHLCVF